jgi:hypothetical protein
MPVADLASATSLARFALVLAAVAVAFLPFGFPLAIVAVGPGTLALILGIAALALRPGARRAREAVAALRAGDHLFAWYYDAHLWQPFVDSEQRRAGRAVWIAAGLIGLAGMVTGILIHSDGDRFFGSSLATIALPAVIGAAFGALIAGALVRASHHAWRLAREYPGLACLGPGGIYLTGQYRPWSRYGQQFMECVLSAGPPPALHFKFIVSGGKTRTVQTMRVPVPEGHGPLAAEVAVYVNRR